MLQIFREIATRKNNFKIFVITLLVLGSAMHRGTFAVLIITGPANKNNNDNILLYHQTTDHVVPDRLTSRID